MSEPSRIDWQARVERLRRLAAENPPAAQEPYAEPNSEARSTAIWERAIPRRFHSAHVAQLEGRVRALADEWDGSTNVLLLGAVGVGKTHAAVAIARKAFDHGVSILFAPAVELLDQLRPNGDPMALDRAKNAGLLVLDDLGSERPTDWTSERLFLLVNDRWLNERPTIVTSNLAAADLEKAVGQRMWSRLYHDASRLSVAGADRRRTA